MPPFKKNPEAAPKPPPKKPRKRTARLFPSVRRSVIMCQDAAVRKLGRHTGAQRVFGFSYDHLCHLFDMKMISLRREVRLGKLYPDSLRAVCVYFVMRSLASNETLRALRRRVKASGKDLKSRRKEKFSPEFIDGFAAALSALGVPI